MATTKSNVKEAPSKAASKSSTAKTTAAKDKESKASDAKSTAKKSTTTKAASSRSAAAKSNPGRKSSGSKSSSSMTTTDHEEIKKWAESRDGKPSMVAATGGKGDSGILRFDFPGYSGKDSLEEISWEDFFKKFDESNLQFLYQEKTSTGKPSRFNKFVSK